MTAEMVPMVARRCDSVSWVRSDSSCCCNCARRSVSESESAVEVVGVVLTKECTPVNCYRQLPGGAFSKQNNVQRKMSSGSATGSSLPVLWLDGHWRTGRQWHQAKDQWPLSPPPPFLPPSLAGGE